MKSERIIPWSIVFVCLLFILYLGYNLVSSFNNGFENGRIQGWKESCERDFKILVNNSYGNLMCEEYKVQTFEGLQEVEYDIEI